MAPARSLAWGLLPGCPLAPMRAIVLPWAPGGARRPRKRKSALDVMWRGMGTRGSLTGIRVAGYVPVRVHAPNTLSFLSFQLPRVAWAARSAKMKLLLSVAIVGALLSGCAAAVGPDFCKGRPK